MLYVFNMVFPTSPFQAVLDRQKEEARTQQSLKAAVVASDDSGDSFVRGHPRELHPIWLHSSEILKWLTSSQLQKSIMVCQTIKVRKKHDILGYFY